MFRKLLQNQYLPNIRDIKNLDVEILSKRLKADSHKKTLTNILEWQERNIQQWVDRWYMFIILYLLLVGSFYLLPISWSYKYIVICIFVILALINITQFLSYFIPLLSYIIALSVWAISINPNFENIFPLIQIIPLSVLFGGILFLFMYLILKYRGLKSRYPDFKLEDTFKISLSIERILLYKLAICRDYAKLTAILLKKMYPDNKIYFFIIPHHVAAGIRIDNELYVLDQRLPVSTSKKWLEFWKNRFNKKKIQPTLLEMIIKEDAVKLKDVEFPKTNENEKSKLDVVKFTEDAAQILEIEQYSRKKIPDLTTRFKNFSLLLEDDEISKYSLVIAVKNKLFDEFCGNSDKIKKINIKRDKEDLVLDAFI